MDDSAWIGALRRVAAMQPQHAGDACGDLAAVTARWSPAARARLACRVVAWAEAGVPLPAALVLALGERLDD
jgi:hypothetical protein